MVHERLCYNPEPEARAVFDFLGWSMEEQTLRFIRRSTTAGENSLASRLQFHQPYFRIYRDPIGSTESWKSALTDRQREQILSVVCPHFPYDELWESGGQPDTNRQVV